MEVPVKDHIIYSLWNGGLGDHWASISLLARLSLHTGREINFSSQGEHEKRHQEILRLLDLGDARLIRYLGPGNTCLDGFDVWATDYFPAIHQWSDKRLRPYICFHFEGQSAAADKNPSEEEQRKIREWAAFNKLEVITLSGGLSLELITRLLAGCTLFVGCDSGMSHIAHSVGCPTYLLEYKLPVVTCHRHKKYVLCHGAGHFMQQADNWMHYLSFLGIRQHRSTPEIHY